MSRRWSMRWTKRMGRMLVVDMLVNKEASSVLVEDATVLGDQVHGRLERLPAGFCTLEKVGRKRLKHENGYTREDLSMQVDILR